MINNNYVGASRPENDNYDTTRERRGLVSYCILTFRPTHKVTRIRKKLVNP